MSDSTRFSLRRIAVLTTLAAASFIVATPAHAAQETATVLPAVNMEAVLKAAQIDPRRADDTQTPTSQASPVRS